MEETSYSYDRTLHLRMKECSSLHESDIEKIISECIKISDASECKTFVHYFEPHGLSSSSILSESHINFHITPEEGQRYVQMDLSTCGMRPNPVKTVNYMLNEFSPKYAKMIYEFRGFESSAGLFPKNIGEFITEMLSDENLRIYKITDGLVVSDGEGNIDEYRLELRRRK
jgi:S-adenosylmethionine/arginine decarboxylase-like enzyme